MLFSKYIENLFYYIVMNSNTEGIPVGYIDSNCTVNKLMHILYGSDTEDNGIPLATLMKEDSIYSNDEEYLKEELCVEMYKNFIKDILRDSEVLNCSKVMKYSKNKVISVSARPHINMLRDGVARVCAEHILEQDYKTTLSTITFTMTIN